MTNNVIYAADRFEAVQQRRAHDELVRQLHDSLRNDQLLDTALAVLDLAMERERGLAGDD